MDDRQRKKMRNMVEATEPEKWRGLGDVVASATKKLGIEPCTPCEKRRQWLNKMISFTK